MSKAIIVQPGGGYQNVTIGSREAAAPKAGEITVRLHANSLNYHDFAVVSGMWGPSEPRIPMADGAGEVIAVGPNVTEFKVGDAVLVQGTGGVSIFALQFAKLAGATVIATSSSDAKLEKLNALGADHLINYKSTPQWGTLAREMSGGRGVDHIVEVGGPATLEQSMLAARVGGHISVIGILTGLAGDFPLVTALIKQLRLQGVLVGNRAQQQAMIKAIDANGMQPVVDKVFAVEEIVQAFQYQETNQHVGKICLQI